MMASLRDLAMARAERRAERRADDAEPVVLPDLDTVALRFYGIVVKNLALTLNCILERRRRMFLSVALGQWKAFATAVTMATGLEVLLRTHDMSLQLSKVASILSAMQSKAYSRWFHRWRLQAAAAVHVQALERCGRTVLASIQQRALFVVAARRGVVLGAACGKFFRRWVLALALQDNGLEHALAEVAQLQAQLRQAHEATHKYKRQLITISASVTR